ncbi:patatin-like phospholipase family protein [Wenjunlia tyrosinilytica]|uniref:Patatin n=1 Tax=Wenjunlia tyrosinilytica TaxID=1544741 RepID=A0A917ZXK1_9ACTN|nr:patatin-like phospholipase family protein [Wenjunlia tyrosinilytica]GGO97366.1 patatin [Wenjunlia tyrosinilytica]
MTTSAEGVSEPEADKPGAARAAARAGAEAGAKAGVRAASRSRGPRPRRGLVLGGGGTLGAAWAIGALCALEEATGWDPRSADVIVGTSAGSILGALLSSGVSPCELRDHQRGTPLTSGPLSGLLFDYDTATGGPLPPPPRLGIGSPSLLRRTVRHPRSYPFQTVVSAFLPTGRATMDGIGVLLAALGPVEDWPDHAGLRMVAVDYDTGERVAFGAPEAPAAGVGEAVLASCAIPGWFVPVTIDGHRYVDGGTWSATSIDLLLGHEMDEVYVLAPMASRDLDQPRSLPARVERRYRRSVTRKMLREAKALEEEGARVELVVPGPQDLTVMGANMMDPVHRLRVLETSLRTSAAALRAATA